MEFTREAWENAPEGARLEFKDSISVKGHEVHLIGYKRNGSPIIEFQNGRIDCVCIDGLRISPPKRKVTVQLWRTESGSFWTCAFDTDRPMPESWTLLGKHTFEIEGE